MSETAITHTGGGVFATARRGGIDAYDVEFIRQRRKHGAPDSAIAKMLGRPVESVSSIDRALPATKDKPTKSRAYIAPDILALIAELEAKHGAKPGSVLSPSATPKSNEARLEAYCRVRALRDARGRHRFTYPAMAEMFDRHHTTISTAIAKHSSRYEVSA